jgi:hypothetical protein
LRLSPLPGPGIYRLTRRHVPVGHEEGPDNRDSEVGSDVPAWSTYDPYVLAQVLQNVDYFAMIDNDADSFRDDVPPAEVAERAIQRQILANVPPEIAENSCPICLLHLSTDSQSVDDNQSDSQSVDDNQSDSQSVDDNQSDSQSVDENQSDNQPDDCSDYNSVDNNTDESIVCLINCQHMFHKRCLLPWIRSEVSSRNCPCCRGTLLDNVDIE